MNTYLNIDLIVQCVVLCSILWDSCSGFAHTAFPQQEKSRGHNLLIVKDLSAKWKATTQPMIEAKSIPCMKILECYFSASLAYKTKHTFRLTFDCIKISHQMMEDIMVGVSVTVTTTKSMCNSLYTMKLIRSSQSKFWKWILKSPYVVLEFDAL